MNSRRLTLASAFVAAAALSGFGRDLYNNDFAARASYKAMPAGQWFVSSYSTAIPSPLCYYFTQSVMTYTPLAPYGDLTKQQGGWVQSVGPENERGIQFWIRTRTGSDNPCVCGSNQKGSSPWTNGMIIQSLYNSFTTGRMRVMVDMKCPTEIGSGSAEEIRIKMLYDRANTPGTTTGGPSPFTFGMTYGCDKMGEMGRSDWGYQNINATMNFDRTHWYRLVCDANLDAPKGSINFDDLILTAYDMGTTQPTLATPTPGTPMGTSRTPLALTKDENGGVSALAFYASRSAYKTWDTDGSFAPDQCPAIDNLRVWWRPDAGTFDESNLCYEDDFATRRVRTLAQKSTAASYSDKLVETNAETYVFWGAYGRSQANARPGNLTAYSSGKTTRRDFRQRIDWIYSSFSVYESGEGGGNVLSGVQPSTAAQDDYFSRMCQPIGTTIESDFIKLEFDFRVPGTQVHWGNGYWNSWIALDSGNDFADPIRVGYDASAWTPSAPVYYAGYSGSGSPGSFYDTTKPLTRLHWYRARAVLNRKTGLMDCSFYDLGTSSGSLDRDVPATPTYSFTGISFDAAKNYAYVGVTGYDFGADWTSAYLYDNIRIWKGTDGSNWDLVYQNDFNKRVRYGVQTVREAKLLPEDVNRVGLDGWIRRGAGVDDMYLRNASNPYVTIEGEGSFAHAVHTLKPTKKGKITVRADIRPPSRMTAKADYPGCVYVGGDEYAQGEIGTQAGLRTFTDAAFGCFGFARSGAIEKMDYYNHAVLFAKGAAGEVLDTADADLTSWYRFVATFDLTAKTWHVDVYKQGTAQPTAASADGTLVKSFENLTFVNDDPSGFSAIGIAGGGTTGDRPLEADKRGVLFDNLTVKGDDFGMVFLVK